MADTTNNYESLEKTALHALHVELGARMVPFAGYDMPVQYAEGVKAEHLWTRAHTGLFDVSHMGPALFRFREGAGSGDPDADFKALAKRIERVLPSNVSGLKPGRLRYTVLLNDEGGIADDMFVGHPSVPSWRGGLYVVVNAGVKETDFPRLQAAMGDDVELVRYDAMASLIALQGPDAEAVLAEHVNGVETLSFMDFARFDWLDGSLIISRSGYTGEDGFEILVGNNAAETLVRHLLRDDRVKPIGLGARDSLRLEAGLCLYGHDLDESVSPVEADLGFVMQKNRREAGDFAGAGRILKELSEGPSRKRVGIQPLEAAPAREGTDIEVNGTVVGVVTSGGFGPSHERPVAMGYVASAHAAPGTKVDLMVRGKARPAEIVELPFVAHRYKR